MAVDRISESTAGEVKLLTAKHLRIDKKTERGGKILKGKGVLVRMPEIENSQFSVRVEDGLITPNPDQPRQYFNAEELQELGGSIRLYGQQDAIKVVPYFDGEKVKLFIIDGERRYRAFQMLGLSHIRLTVHWAKDEEEIFEKSLISNESRANHNPVERAFAYKKLLGFEKQKGTENPVQAIAVRLGISVQTIRNHLKLLELPKEILDLVAKGQLPASHLFAIPAIRKKFGDKLDLVRAARILLDSLEAKGPEESGDTITADAVSAAIRKALIEGGAIDQVSELGAKKAVFALLSDVRRIVNSAGRFLEADKKITMDFLRARARGQPPEVFRDAIAECMEDLRQALEFITRVVEPDPLPVIPGKPTFSKFLALHKDTFKIPFRFQIAQILARISDENKTVFTASEIAEELGSDSTSVANNMRILKEELSACDIELKEYEVRRRGMDKDYDKKTGYRLAWLPKEITVAPTPSRALESRPQSPAPSPKPPPPPPPTPKALPTPPLPPKSPPPPAPKSPLPPTQKASTPPPAKIAPPENKPPFVDYLMKRKIQDILGGTTTKEYFIALALAQNTDAGGGLLRHKLVEMSGLAHSADIQALFESTRTKLAKVGILIERIPRQDGKSAFRLKWQEQKRGVSVGAGLASRVEKQSDSRFSVIVDDTNIPDPSMRLSLKEAVVKIGQYILQKHPRATHVVSSRYPGGLVFVIGRPPNATRTFMVSSNFLDGESAGFRKTFNADPQIVRILAKEIGRDAGDTVVMCLDLPRK